jgi:gliding motility-associated-like protein
MNRLLIGLGIWWFSFFLFIGKTYTQVDSPVLLCIKGDSILWEVDPMPCGNFLGLDIYYATNVNGPFTLLQTITDITTIAYEHTIAQPNRFYYLIARYDCVDGISSPSDTLANRPPISPKVNFITVEGNGVRLDWEPSPSAQTRNYVIYRATTQGTIPIDTVSGNVFTYIDMTANPGAGIEYYYVLAMDACGNTSGFDDNQNTIFLEVTTDECTREATLRWNDYRFFPNGYDEWEVFVSVDGSGFIPFVTTPSDETTFTYEDLMDGVTYCFRIEVQENGSPFRSVSNEVCLTADVIEPVRFLCLLTATAQENNVLLTWNIHENADLDYFRILAGTRTDNINETLLNVDQPGILDNPGQLTDNTIDPSRQIRYYQIETMDLCGRIVRSDIVSNLFLSGRLLPGRQNQLLWDAFLHETGIVTEYQVYRVEDDGSERLLDILTPLDSGYIDQITGPATGNTTFCYRLISVIEIECEGVMLTTLLPSNIFCVEQNSSILLPNAFVPDGRNPVFKPVILYRESINNYTLQIFGRWGDLLFESNDPDRGWDGRVNGRSAPMGSYAYYVRAVQNNGRIIEEKGLVTLVR